jgi:hypothetical protein
VFSYQKYPKTPKIPIFLIKKHPFSYQKHPFSYQKHPKTPKTAHFYIKNTPKTPFFLSKPPISSSLTPPPSLIATTTLLKHTLAVALPPLTVPTGLDVLFSAFWGFFMAKIPENDRKMTEKWPKTDRNIPKIEKIALKMGKIGGEMEIFGGKMEKIGGKSAGKRGIFRPISAVRAFLGDDFTASATATASDTVNGATATVSGATATATGATAGGSATATATATSATATASVNPTATATATASVNPTATATFRENIGPGHAHSGILDQNRPFSYQKSPFSAVFRRFSAEKVPFWAKNAEFGGKKGEKLHGEAFLDALGADLLMEGGYLPLKNAENRAEIWENGRL